MGGGGQTPMRDKIKVPLEWRRMRLVSGRSEPGPIGYFQSSRFRHRYQMVRVRVRGSGRVLVTKGCSTGPKLQQGYI